MATQNRLTREQKIQFIQQVSRRSEKFAMTCRAFRISRQTGYKWWRRYQRSGPAGLAEQSRRPRRQPHACAPVWSERVVVVRRRHRRWGAKKIHAALRRTHPRARLPAISTIGRILRRLGWTQPRPRRPIGPRRHWPSALRPRQPNDLWTVDFKGHFHTRDGSRCDPLTVRDYFSRYGLCARILAGQNLLAVRAWFQRLFIRHGIPKAIRSDQGVPFAGSGPAHLSRLSAWWISLGIRVEVGRRAHPEDNAAHEQWHREMKADIANPPATTLAAQQRRQDHWRRSYNLERPHEALSQQVPAQVYYASRRRYRGVRPPRYPTSWSQRRVKGSGEIYWHGRMRFITEAVAGYRVALRPWRRGVWRVYFYHVLLGELHDADPGRMRPAIYHRKTQSKLSAMS